MKLLFDLDGTLIDSNGIWQEIDRAFLAKRGFALTDAYNEGVIHATFPTAAKFTKEYCRLPESVEEIMAEWRAAAYHAYAHTIPLKPGVNTFLAQCKKAEHTLAIYTSCEEDLCYAALEHHQIRPFFSAIFFVRNLNLPKRAPEGFLRVAHELGAAPEEILFFDDSPQACQGAKEAGLHVIGCYDALFADARQELQSICDGTIESFEQLLARPRLFPVL